MEYKFIWFFAWMMEWITMLHFIVLTLYIQFPDISKWMMAQPAHFIIRADGANDGFAIVFGCWHKYQFGYGDITIVRYLFWMENWWFIFLESVVCPFFSSLKQKRKSACSQIYVFILKHAVATASCSKQIDNFKLKLFVLIWRQGDSLFSYAIKFVMN